MGDVAVVVRLMPEDADTDLDVVKQQVEDSIEVSDMEEEEVAFGLKAIMVSTIVADGEGGTDAVEDALAEIDGIKSVEITDMNRL